MAMLTSEKWTAGTTEKNGTATVDYSNRWVKLAPLQASVEQREFAKLREAYSDPGRFYHNFKHIYACFGVLDKMFERSKFGFYEWNCIEYAIWYHDVVYDTRSSCNEEESAKWAAQSMATLGRRKDHIEYVQRLIMCTKHGSRVTFEGSKRSADVVVDVDLSILGETTETYDKFEADIRREYAWVPEEVYREGRRSVLSSFLNREWVYNTAEMRKSEYEARARFNLNRALEMLA